MKNSKNLILWLELLFAVLSFWVLQNVSLYPTHAMTALRIYILGMIVLTVSLVVSVRYYQSQHSTIDVDKLCEMVQRIDVPAFIWSDDLSVMFANSAMDELLGITGEEPDQDNTVLLSGFFHSISVSPKEAGEIMSEQTLRTGLLAPDGRKRHIAWTTSTLKKNNTASLLFSIGFETTELENAKMELTKYAQELLTSQTRYDLSMKLSGVGFLLAETTREEYYVSEEAMKFLGISKNCITFQEFRKKIHQDDRIKFDDYLVKIRSLPDTDTRISRPKTLEIRLWTKGQYVWYAYQYHENLRNKDGRPIIGGALIDITNEKRKDARIKNLAFNDEVTGIFNRNKLMHEGAKLYQMAVEAETQGYHYRYWVIVLDIDRFHIINDSCGYEKGDKILKAFAHILCEYTANSGLVARISADNFVLILQRYDDDDGEPAGTIEQIRESLAELAKEDFAGLSLSCSAGFASMPTSDSNDFKEVLEHAEFALAVGKGELSYLMGYDAKMHQEILYQGEMEKSLSEAIEKHYLQLYYQPKVDIHTEKIIGAEALIRWIQPDGTMISPNVFIPIAEKAGMISAISHFVLCEACEQTAKWQEMGLPRIVMSINFASGDFYQANVCEVIRNQLAKFGLEPKYLELELTERLALGDINYTVQQMNALREMGILLAMDDFGTGYSSLSYIQLLPLTLLKLDRSFIIEIETDKVAQEIVSAVIKIAKSMHMETIAEGVEYQPQAEILKEMGCDYIQGYLYGKPMPPEEFQKRLEANT
ncbi:MAG: EAL domain-containing protein [Oscillospiraceae bacterium]|nr:EAL domain-containing protein [Oscillospiraceae bacterium]